MQIKVIKLLDKAPQSNKIALDEDLRDFMLVVRQALLMVVAFIERRCHLTTK